MHWPSAGPSYEHGSIMKVHIRRATTQHKVSPKRKETDKISDGHSHVQRMTLSGTTEKCHGTKQQPVIHRQQDTHTHTQANTRIDGHFYEEHGRREEQGWTLVVSVLRVCAKHRALGLEMMQSVRRIVKENFCNAINSELRNNSFVLGLTRNYSYFKETEEEEQQQELDAVGGARIQYISRRSVVFFFYPLHCR